MHPKDYTPEIICHCLCLAGFEADPVLSVVERSMRLLLQPTFHPEICLTIADAPERSIVSVAAAREMVRGQFAPAPVLTDRDKGEIAAGCFSELCDAFAEAADVRGSDIVIDGMPVDALLFRRDVPILRVRWNASNPSPFSAFVARSISVAWNGIRNPACRNALAKAARYAGLDLPIIPVPQQKPIVRTMVLGLEEDRQPLLQAFRKQNDRDCQ